MEMGFISPIQGVFRLFSVFLSQPKYHSTQISTTELKSPQLPSFPCRFPPLLLEFGQCLHWQDSSVGTEGNAQ